MISGYWIFSSTGEDGPLPKLRSYRGGATLMDWNRVQSGAGWLRKPPGIDVGAGNIRQER